MGRMELVVGSIRPGLHSIYLLSNIRDGTMGYPTDALAMIPFLTHRKLDL
jgi:hypothetical protein